MKPVIIERPRLLLKGEFVGRHYRHGKCIETIKGHNGPTYEGFGQMLGAMFKGTAGVSPWYFGLIEASPTPQLLNNDTLASHTGWEELTPSTDYTGNRKEWVEGTVVNGVLGTTTAAQFAFTSTQVVRGLLLCGAATGTSAVLWATGLFDTDFNLSSGSTLDVSYSITLAEATG